MARKWTKEDWIKIFEMLIEKDPSLLSNRRFRGDLDRDQNLLANQFVRDANGNIAYRRVDFDIDGLTDEEFWNRIDASDYSDLIESNAASAIMKMLEKNKELP